MDEMERLFDLLSDIEDSLKSVLSLCNNMAMNQLSSSKLGTCVEELAFIQIRASDAGAEAFRIMKEVLGS